MEHYLKNRLKSVGFTIVNCCYLLFLLFSCTYWTVNFNLINLLMSFLYMFLVPLLYTVEKLLKITFGTLFTILLYIIPVGSILGSCFNFYTLIPFLDLILHGISGLIFACLGFCIFQIFLKVENNKSFFGCLLFALFFSLAIATLWEIFEYSVSCSTSFDMLADSYVYKINSYVLSGIHGQAVNIDGITKTIIYYGNDKTFTINGYLDLGLVDTLGDMIICSIGTAVFCLITIISYYKIPTVYKTLIPQLKIKDE